MMWRTLASAAARRGRSTATTITTTTPLRTLTDTQSLTTTITTPTIHSSNSSRSFATKTKDYSLTVPLWSPGVIIDPFVPEPPEGVPFFLTPAGFRIRLRQLAGNLKSGVAAARIRKALPNFRPDEAPDLAEDMFRVVHRAYEEEDRTTLRENVTEQLFPPLRRGMQKRWALTNTDTTPLRLVGMANRPNLVSMRVLNVDKENKEKTFAQLTVRVDGEYVDANEGIVAVEMTTRPLEGAAQDDATAVTAEDVAKFSSRRNRNHHGKRGSTGTKKEKRKSEPFVLPPKDRNHATADRGEWRHALDENGKVYYWHTKTMQRTWDKPSEFGVITGDGSSDLVDEGEDGENVDRRTKMYRSEKYIVLERDLYLGEQGKWRMCKIQ